MAHLPACVRRGFRRVFLHRSVLLVLAAGVAAPVTSWAQSFGTGPRVLINQVGYEASGSKKFVVQVPGNDAAAPGAFKVIDVATGATAAEGKVGKLEQVDGWKRGQFARGDFSAVTRPGTYRIRVAGPRGEIVSEPFQVGTRLLGELTLSDLMFYFKSQRSSGIFDQTDRKAPVFSPPGKKKRPPVDVHGGWYDASGDVSKYLSHLSFANYMNPQQTPFVVWSLLESADQLKDDKSPRLGALPALMQEEALHGADFLVRMQDPAGYFYITVFDVWSHDPSKRELCAYETQKGNKTDAYQAGFREGGGLAIAALARASMLGRTGDYPPKRYLATAEKGFAHLQANNLKYLDDKQENIIDDYTALLAATELYAATKKAPYLEAARKRQAQLVARLHKDAKWSGYWRADATGQRPYFHAAEAGLPVVALLRYRAIEPVAATRDDVLKAVEQSLTFELGITREVANPFGYARQYVKDLGGGTRSSFFFPHKNESGYWWQGENARLSSLAAAATLAARDLPGKSRALRAYAADQLDWILGLNPYDMSMLQGKGRHNPEYLAENPNAPGGICNGITSGFDDERDIAFLPPPHDKNPDQNWRWSEQWIPHGAWYVLAVSAAAVNDRPAK
jgi:hypothetical protein